MPEGDRKNSATKPRRNKGKGLVCVLLGVVFFLAGGFAIIAVRYGQMFGLGRTGEAESFLLIAAGVACAAIGIRLAATGHRLRTDDGEDVVRKKQGHQFLYLRSFGLDEQDNRHTFPVYMGLSIPINPWEGSIAAGFAGAGNLVAIGRPGEKLATPGAARIYVTDDAWQNKVLELADSSDLIVWAYGATEGLRWEISKLVNAIPPEKLVIAMPFWSVPVKQRREIWNQAVASIGHVFLKPLPRDIGDSLFVTFDRNWNPIPIKARPPHIMIRAAMLFGWNRITQGIRGVLDLRNIPYPGPSAYALIGSAIATMAWMSIAGVILVMMYGLIQAFA